MQETLTSRHGESGVFARWPGLMRLTVGWVGGPIAALANQQLTYVANMWACGHGHHGVLHVIPLICLAAAIGVGVLAYRDWAMVGRGVEDEEATVATRSRFVSLLGMAMSALSALVILAQWLAVFVFDPCMRA
jgi:hypothetical protein